DDTGLTSSTTYSYRVRASDTNNTRSAYSNTASAATTDTIPPTAPTYPHATPVSTTQINLSWTASTDSTGVTGYRIERCQDIGCADFSQIAAPSSPSYIDSGLSAGTSYSYRVRAADAAANLSAYSTIKSAVTHPAPPANLAATASGGTDINLTWTA